MWIHYKLTFPHQKRKDKRTPRPLGVRKKIITHESKSKFKRVKAYYLYIYTSSLKASIHKTFAKNN